jgi:HNH endonuclease
MTAKTSQPTMRVWIAAAATLIVAATFAGSASALAAIGHRAGMADPWALPVALDGLAIVAATAIHRRRRDPIAWAALVATVAVSTWLQVGPASAGLVDVTVRAVPPIAGGVVLVGLAGGSFDWTVKSPSSSSSRRRHLPTQLRITIIERDGLVCGLCRGEVEPGDVHIDHIHPVSLGGTDDPDNLQVTHSICNLIKGARV